MFVFIVVLLLAFVISLTWSYLVMKLPGVASTIVNRWNWISGWLIAILGVLVFALGFQGFMLKHGKTTGGWAIAFYETVQLYFLNAPDDASKNEPEKDESNGKGEAGPHNDQTKGSEPVSAQAKSKENQENAVQESDVNWWIIWADVCAVFFVVLVAFEAITRLFYGTFTKFRLAFATDHIVICGYGRIGRAIVSSYISSFNRLGLRAKGANDGMRRRRSVVVIDDSLTKDDIEWTRSNGVIVLVGDAREKEILQTANVSWAHKVFIATGADDVNLEVAAQVLGLSNQNSSPWYDRVLSFLDRGHGCAMAIYIHLLSQDMIDLARPRLTNARREVLVEIFNTLDRTARLLMEEIVTIPELNRWDTDPTKSKHPHLFWFGFENTGQQLALRVAELMHYEDGNRPRVTIFDRQVQRKARVFRTRYRAFSRDFYAFGTAHFDENARSFDNPEEAGKNAISYVCDADFSNYVDVNDPVMMERIKLAALDSVPIVVFAFENGKDNLIAAERFAALFHGSGQKMHVYAWLGDSTELIGQRIKHKLVEFPVGFGMCQNSITYQEVADGWVEVLARWLNMAYAQPADPKDWNLVQAVFKRIRDEGPYVILSEEEIAAAKAVEKEALVKWREFENDPLTCEDFQHSNLLAATHAIVKLAYVGLRIVGYQRNLKTQRPDGEHREKLLALLNLEEPRIMEHNRWVSERLFRGWKHAEDRNNLKKQRPQICRWTPLSDKEKTKDEAQIQMLVDLCLCGLLVTEPIETKEEQQIGSV